MKFQLGKYYIEFGQRRKEKTTVNQVADTPLLVAMSLIAQARAQARAESVLRETREVPSSENIKTEKERHWLYSLEGFFKGLYKKKKFNFDEDEEEWHTQ